MLQGVGDAEVHVNQLLDWIDGDAKLTEWEACSDNYYSKDEDDLEVLDIATPIRVKDEDAVKRFSITLQWTWANGFPLSNIVTLQKLKKIVFEKHERHIKQARSQIFLKWILI